MVGQPVADFVDPACCGMVKERIRIMSASPEAVVPLVEERFRCVDGTTVDVEVVATAAMYEGKPAIQVVARDISGRKRTEEALRTANRAAQSPEHHHAPRYPQQGDGHFRLPGADKT